MSFMKRLIILCLFLTACTSAILMVEKQIIVPMAVLGYGDLDQDGIPNIKDSCPNTFQGEIGNEQGCTSRQLRLKALRILPYEFDRRVRYVDRIAIRQTKKYIKESLNQNFYQPDRSYLTCSGGGVFAADFAGMAYLQQLACVELEQYRDIRIRIRGGQGRFVLSSGFGVIVTTGGQVSAIDLTDLGYVSCNEELKPLGEAALNYIVESEKLILDTIGPICDPERVRKNLFLGEKNLAKERYMNTIANHQSAWKAATDCECSRKITGFPSTPQIRRWR